MPHVFRFSARGRVALLLCFPGIAATLNAANNAATSAAADAVQLSPFVISENSETGWVATETLAGSRLRTNFKDVPNQIETLTKEFMDDLGVTNMDRALSYTANVENYLTDQVNQASLHHTQLPLHQRRHVAGCRCDSAGRQRDIPG